MEVLEVFLEVQLVFLPGQTVDACCRVFFKFKERLIEQIDVDMVEERRELFLVPSPCYSPYPFQRRCHPCPTLSPARAVLDRIPLGLRPSLHRLRIGSPRHGLLRIGLLRFVRRLPSYYGVVRLPAPVHHRLRLLAFPMRTACTDIQLTARRGISQLPTRSFCA